MNAKLLLAEVGAGLPLDDPPTRAVLTMALLAFVVLGLGLISGAMIGGRWARRRTDDRLTRPLPLRKADATAVPPGGDHSKGHSGALSPSHGRATLAESATDRETSVGQ